MRRSDRQMCDADAKKTLERGKWGVLSTCCGEVPYGVAVNYVYSPKENAVFFHCAPEGKKTDIIKLNPRVSFAVVTREQIIPEKLTTLYESVIVSGTAKIIEEPHEKVKRLRQLCGALAPEAPGSSDFTDNCVFASIVIRIDIDEITGKKNG